MSYIDTGVEYGKYRLGVQGVTKNNDYSIDRLVGANDSNFIIVMPLDPDAIADSSFIVNDSGFYKINLDISGVAVGDWITIRRSSTELTFVPKEDTETDLTAKVTAVSQGSITLDKIWNISSTQLPVGNYSIYVNRGGYEVFSITKRRTGYQYFVTIPYNRYMQMVLTMGALRNYLTNDLSVKSGLTDAGDQFRISTTLTKSILVDVFVYLGDKNIDVPYLTRVVLQIEDAPKVYYKGDVYVTLFVNTTGAVPRVRYKIKSDLKEIWVDKEYSIGSYPFGIIREKFTAESNNTTINFEALNTMYILTPTIQSGSLLALKGYNLIKKYPQLFVEAASNTYNLYGDRITFAVGDVILDTKDNTRYVQTLTAGVYKFIKQ